jgi:hypothetical protein
MTDKTYFERRILGVTSARPTPTQLPVLEEAVPLLVRAPAHAEHGFRLKLNADSGGS